MRFVLFGPTLLSVALGCGSATPPPALSAPVTSATPAAPDTAPPPTAAASAAPALPMSPGIVNVGDIVGPPNFDAKTTLVGLKPSFLRCYNETRTLLPDLHGKLTLRLRLNETGAVTATEAEPGGHANDPGLLACIADTMKTTTFPKPGGTAVITVPLVFRR
jgi:hypothetical protein